MPRRYVMLTVEFPLDPTETPGAEGTLRAAATALGVQLEALDQSFGLVPIDPSGRRFAVMVDERCVSDARNREGVRGPYANPRIEPFGPPES